MVLFHQYYQLRSGLLCPVKFRSESNVISRAVLSKLLNRLLAVDYHLRTVPVHVITEYQLSPLVLDARPINGPQDALNSFRLFSCIDQ